MMAMVETSSQQVLAANKALEEARAEFNLKITELQQENQYLKEVHKKMQYDPCNPEIEEKEPDEEVMEPRNRKLRWQRQWRIHTVWRGWLYLSTVPLRAMRLGRRTWRIGKLRFWLR